MNITLKPAAAANLPELLELAHQAAKAPNSRWSEDYPDLEILKWDLAQNGLYRAELPDGTTGGMIAIDREGELNDLDWQDGLLAAWELSRLAVFSEYQGTGLGQAIFGAALELCHRESCPGLRLLVSRGFEQGIHIYEKFGFRRVGQTHQWGEDFWMYSLTL